MRPRLRNVKSGKSAFTSCACTFCHVLAPSHASKSEGSKGFMTAPTAVASLGHNELSKRRGAHVAMNSPLSMRKSRGRAPNLIVFVEYEPAG
jgi:hypothetical protein